ncbi:MAG: sigma-70 family RNA polymerase sigma factor [Bacteroidaceae bacterium]|nr:sigma-70 family RNA polymerase sigma factor [Bacteroidaceae bacterium]
MIITHLFKPLSALTDEELMQRVSSKDDDRAYGELYHRHARKLMGFFFRQSGSDEALAADLTQDTFMRVWTARDKFLGSSFRTWLLTIGYNLVKNHYRLSEHQKQYEQFVVQTGEEVAESNIVEHLDNKAFDQALKQLLEKMPPESRLLFSLRFEEELTVPQIAVVMSIPEGTVKSRLHILTQSLKQKLNYHDTVRR